MPISPAPRNRPATIEVLEARIALSATPLAVGRALDLLDGVTISISGNPLQIGTQTLGATGQLLGFPSGGDGDFLILSTGLAAHVTTLQNTGDNQGTDLGPDGADGDEVSVFFTLPVPVGATQQRLKLDFMFLTEEYPEFLNAGFNDTFQVLINGVNYAEDELGNPVEVDNTYFTGDSAPGTFFDGRTNKLTLTYVVPDGETSLSIELRLTDVGDGILDSAVLVDNVRFESPQVVFLDFDGATLANHFGAGITAILPAFDASDLGSPETTAVLIQQIVSKLQAKYADFDVQFTTIEPTSGDYTTLVLGGDNGLLVDISNASPLLRRTHPGASLALGTLFGLGSDSLLGFAGAPDVGNLNRNDRAVIFTGEFDDFFSSLTPEERLDHLVVTLAHELGHNLGLRHVSDANVEDIMKQTAPRGIGAVFGSTLIDLAEQWSDGVTQQNDHTYLTSVLGKANATGLSPSIVQNTVSFSTAGQTLFDVTLTITGSDPDAAPIILHFDKLDGAQNIPLPLLPDGAKLAITAASKLGGAVDVFSGTPQSGELTDAQSAVPLFGLDGNLLSIPLAKGTPGALTAGGSLPLFANHLGAVTLLPKKIGTFTDSDGDIYTVKLTGPGILGYVLDDPDQDGKGGLLKLEVDQTSVGESVLTITVVKGKLGDGRVNFGGITGTLDAGLKSLTAPAVNLTGGGIVFSGALASVSVRDLVNGADLVGGVSAGVKTSVSMHVVGDTSDINLGTEVTTFKAARIGEAGITAAALAKLIVAGDKVAGIPGDIAGQFNIAGLLGSVTARDLLGTARFEAGGSALESSTFVLHEVFDGAAIHLASVISLLKTARIGHALINAQQFDSIAITGDARNFISGDFAAELTATGRIGKFVARDLLEDASIAAGGIAFDKTTFLVHKVADGVSITLESTLASFRAAQVGEATIEAAAVGSLQITGDARAWLSGDFRGALTLSGGDDFFVNTLTNAKFTGSVIGASFVLETIGTFNARSVADSSILAGYTPADAEHPFDGGVFFEGGAIKSFVVGKGGFANTVVASKSLGTINVGALTSENGGTAFGFLSDDVPARVTVFGFAYSRTGPADQSLNDFHVKVV